MKAFKLILYIAAATTIIYALFIGPPCSAIKPVSAGKIIKATIKKNK